ncbi:MAG: serine/threonine-protein kinase, partial [Planctomycetes bacterium]|nr:serine/threonine-protein kinase [Planctomycetota bacterium]
KQGLREDLDFEHIGEHLRRAAEDATLSPTAIRRLTTALVDQTAAFHQRRWKLSLDFLEPSEEADSLGRLGQYEIIEVIGRGGMGIALKARDTRLNRVVAVKVLAPELAANPTARKRFLREARAAAAVSHDYVITTYAVEQGDLPYLVMEFIDGPSLQQKIDRQGALELTEILRIGMQVAYGLAAAHAQGLIHRDIKPSNILLQNGIERVQITDFGLARAADDVTVTRTGEIAGTPDYMSPEQAQGRPVDHRADLFSLGSLLYAMCTGRSPFRADSTMGVLHRVCNDTPRPISDVNPDIPKWLIAVIDRLLAKNADGRFQTAAETAEVLSGCLAHVQQPHVVPLPDLVAGPGRVPSRVSRHRKWYFGVIALALVAGSIGFAEATGVTNLAATVIQIATGEGTLVIESDDPAVKVTLAGDGGVLIAGSGVGEVRLQPGSYRVQADKDGKPVRLDRDLVTITRGDKQVLRVRLKDEPLVNSARITEPGAFAVLGIKGVAERKFDTLAAAVLHTSDGDTIEVRGNGPFLTDPIHIGKNQSLTIRAGEGFRPIIKASPKMEGQTYLIVAGASLAVEGLELQHIVKPPSVAGGKYGIIESKGGVLQVANCRLIAAPGGRYATSDYGSQRFEFRNCEFLTTSGNIGWWGFVNGGRYIMDNCVVAGGGAIGCVPRSDQRDVSVRFTRNTLIGPTILSLDRADLPKAGEIQHDLDPIRFHLSNNVIAGSDSMFLRASENIITGKLLTPEETAAFLPYLKRLLSWREEGNVYINGHRFLRMHPKSLADWRQLWGDSETDCLEGPVRFKGGDLLANFARSAMPKAAADPELVAPDDFRLHPDSVGYRAGPDGKDLGADIDLVGPGPAYERWKKTPQYQQWLAAKALARLDQLPPGTTWYSQRMEFCREVARDQILFAAVQTLRPEDPDLQIARGQVLALDRRWEEAAELFRAAIPHRNETEDDLHLGALLLLSNQPEAYQEFCRKLVEQAGDGALENYPVQTCALVSNPVVAPEKLVNWTEARVEANRSPGNLHAMGLACCRASQYSRALQCLDEVREHIKRWPQPQHAANALNTVARALVHQRQGDAAAAATRLEQARALMGSAKGGSPGATWLEYHVLLRELDSLIESSQNAETTEEALPPSASTGDSSQALPPAATPEEYLVIANRFAAEGDWNRAILAFEAAAERGARILPGDTLNYLPLYVKAQRREDFDRACVGFFPHWLLGNTKDSKDWDFTLVNNACEAIILAELTPQTGGKAAWCDELAEKVMSLMDREHNDVPRRQLAIGMWHYRKKRFEEALKILPQDDWIPSRRTLSYLFQSMSHAQLGKNDAARSSHQAALKIVQEDMPPPGTQAVNTYFQPLWAHWLRIELVRGETESLLAAQGAISPETRNVDPGEPAPTE